MAATRRLDETGFDRAWDDGPGRLDALQAVAGVAMPFMHAIGEGWAAGTVGIGQEHFASNLVRQRLVGLRPTTAPAGPQAVLACPSGERHDLGLLAFGVLMAHEGWRVRFLGADTPLADLARACHQVEPQLVILSATRARVFEARATALTTLARSFPLAFGGSGASEELAQELGGTVLPQELDRALAQVASLAAPSD